jgi:hypothetical protein
MSSTNSVNQLLRFYTLDGWQFDQLSSSAQQEILQVLNRPTKAILARSRSQSPIGERKPAPRTDNYSMHYPASITSTK